MFSFWGYMSCSVPTSTFQGVIPYPAQVKFALALWKNDIDQSSLLSRRGTAVSTLKGSKSHRQRTWWEVLICNDFLRKIVQCVTTFNRCPRCFQRGGGCPIHHSIWSSSAICLAIGRIQLTQCLRRIFILTGLHLTKISLLPKKPLNFDSKCDPQNEQILRSS